MASILGSIGLVRMSAGLELVLIYEQFIFPLSFLINNLLATYAFNFKGFELIQARQIFESVCRITLLMCEFNKFKILFVSLDSKRQLFNSNFGIVSFLLMGAIRDLEQSKFTAISPLFFNTLTYIQQP